MKHTRLALIAILTERRCQVEGRLCQEDDDCPEGAQRCNTIWTPLTCQDIRCGGFLSPCDRDLLCSHGYRCLEGLSQIQTA
jgi:hypothetical protein